jgi:hypothetical protein
LIGNIISIISKRSVSMSQFIMAFGEEEDLPMSQIESMGLPFSVSPLSSFRPQWGGGKTEGSLLFNISGDDRDVITPDEVNFVDEIEGNEVYKKVYLSLSKAALGEAHEGIMAKIQNFLNWAKYREEVAKNPPKQWNNLSEYSAFYNPKNGTKPNGEGLTQKNCEALLQNKKAVEAYDLRPYGGLRISITGLYAILMIETKETKVGEYYTVTRMLVEGEWNSGLGATTKMVETKEDFFSIESSSPAPVRMKKPPAQGEDQIRVLHMTMEEITKRKNAKSIIAQLHENNGQALSKDKKAIIICTDYQDYQEEEESLDEIPF